MFNKKGKKKSACVFMHRVPSRVRLTMVEATGSLPYNALLVVELRAKYLKIEGIPLSFALS